MLKNTLFILIGASLTACSSHLELVSTSGKIPINENQLEKKELTFFINPYKDSMNRVMSEVIAQAPVDFEYSRPNGLLGNWTTDALLANQTRMVRMSDPVICLLNAGGLRSSIGKGNVTIGDLFRLMPFDNEVVWIKLPISSIEAIEKYILRTGGEPISNASCIDGELHIFGLDNNSMFFWVITSDYLANGGDRMDFFKDAVERVDKHILLRDVFIQESKFQKELIVSPDIRIK